MSSHTLSATPGEKFDLMLLALLGDPAPALPELPGRRHICQDDGADAEPPPPASERDRVLMSSLSNQEAGSLLGLSRQRVSQLRQQQARAALNNESDAYEGATTD